MKRISVRFGDLFCVKIDDHYKKYFQYIAEDMTQLGSDVIRVFEKAYPIEENPTLEEIITDKVDFYAHCIVKIGVKQGLWEKIGSANILGSMDILFRVSDDEGNVKVSKKWLIWQMNEEEVYVGKLQGENIKAEIGIVITPASIVYRMKTGSYDFVYPAY